MHRGRRLECPLLSQFDSPMILTGSGAQVGEASNDRTGWTVGAGVEWNALQMKCTSETILNSIPSINSSC